MFVNIASWRNWLAQLPDTEKASDSSSDEATTVDCPSS